MTSRDRTAWTRLRSCPPTHPAVPEPRSSRRRLEKECSHAKAVHGFGTAVAIVATLLLAPDRAQAQLALQVDSTQGFPGDVVNGQVDPATVPPNCNTTVGQVTATFGEFSRMMSDPAFAEPFWGPIDDNFLFVPVNEQQLSYYFLTLATAVIELNFNNAAQMVLDQSFVMTFADILTQSPVGDLGSFDPVTGVGSVVVPDVAPGLWAVAASCVEPRADRIAAAVEAGKVTLQGIAVPLPPDFDLFGALETYAALMLPPLMGPKAFGFQLYTILGPSPIDLDQATAWRTRSKPARITLKGTIQTGQFGARDVLAPPSDFSFTVSDGLNLRHSVSVPASDCSVNARGVITCRNAAKTVKITFRPKPGAPGAYAFKIELTRLDFDAPQAGSLTLDMQYGIPRQGVASSCKVNEIKLACRG